MGCLVEDMPTTIKTKQNKTGRKKKEKKKENERKKIGFIINILCLLIKPGGFDWDLECFSHTEKRKTHALYSTY